MSLETLSIAERRARSALVIKLPEIAQLIGDYRRAYTEDGPSVPPHITLLSPFLAPVETTPTVLHRLANLAGTFPCFQFAAERVEQFPTGVLYLAIEPADTFRDLIGHLRQEFPDVAPYWDQFDRIVPHITVADAALTDTPEVFKDIAANLSSRLPAHFTATEIVLVQRVRPAPAPWDIQGRFALRCPAGSSQSSLR